PAPPPAQPPTLALHDALPIWLDSLSEGHSLSHSGPSNETATLQLVARAKWHAEQLAYFMDLLSQIPEGDGSILDNTAILWGNEVDRKSTRLNSSHVKISYAVF